MEIQSFDLLPPTAEAAQPHELDGKESDSPAALRARVQAVEQIQAPDISVLRPDFRNIHSFRAGSDIGCAILDILTPSYDPANGRDCTYYRRTRLDSSTVVPNSVITVYRDHPDFRVVEIPYLGPPIY